MLTAQLALASSCTWCLAAPATTTIKASPSCASCAAGDPRYRVTTWLRAVGRRGGV